MFTHAGLEDLLFLHLFHWGTCEIFHPPVNITSRAPAGMNDDVSRGVAPHLDNSFRASSGAVINTEGINKQGFAGLSQKTTNKSRDRLLNKPRAICSVRSSQCSHCLWVREKKSRLSILQIVRPLIVKEPSREGCTDGNINSCSAGCAQIGVIFIQRLPLFCPGPARSSPPSSTGKQSH